MEIAKGAPVRDGALQQVTDFSEINENLTDGVLFPVKSVPLQISQEENSIKV